jgi:hypothetical protein
MSGTSRQAIAQTVMLPGATSDHFPFPRRKSPTMLDPASAEGLQHPHYPPWGHGLSRAHHMRLERISIEVTNRCAKACWFCYNGTLFNRLESA